MFQNNLRCLNYKSRGVNRGFCISNNISTPRKLSCNNHKNKYFIFYSTTAQNRADHFFLQDNEVGQSMTHVILKHTCRKSCSLLQPRAFDDLFSFWKVIGFNLLIFGASVVLHIIRYSAINIVDYLFLSTICIQRGWGG